ncbi:hypothetical protein F511_25027 [Dorcoceras hygrometricum]|uniref:Uncharacterized protein n=1 Tax=Dorcoceras hygrometricum TaxID=472368 RepID=A0A2Z7BS18_9LAMI|nr:hypothetical protein F511_25027 [Dorcoceras hygrometricum]
MNQLERRQPAASAKERSEPAVLEAIQREEIQQRLYIRGDAIEEVFDEVGHCEDIADNKSIAQCINRGKMKRKTVEVVVHLWSLGVLTAAGCGIGSVPAVVRSNLLVEPFEVEEGEM